MRRSVSLLLLFVTFITLFGWNLGKVPLFDPDEGRYSDMSLTMLKTGDWMIPRMNGIIHLHKPPLANWLIAASFKVFGINEFAARIPSLLLSLLLLGLLIRMGTFLFNFRAGYLSAWILGTSGLYLAVSRLVTTDMTLTFMTFFTVFAITHFLFLERRRIFYFYLIWIGLGLGMLTKGPVAWMITLTPTLAFSIWRKSFPRVSWFHWVLGFFIFAGLSLSWYLAVIFTHPGAWDYFLHYQLLGRIVKGSAGRAHPVFYYLLIVPLGFFPWTLFLPASWKWPGKETLDSDQLWKRRFVLCWFIVPFILFSLFRTKLATYIVPLFPPLALWAGIFWDRALQDDAFLKSAWMRSTTLITGILLGLLPVGGLIFISLRPHFVAGISWALQLVLLILLVIAAYALWKIWKLNRTQTVFPALTVIMILVGFLGLSALPAIQYKNSKGLVSILNGIKKPGEKVLLWGDYYASLLFYLQERVVEISLNTERVFEKPEILNGYVFDDHAVICDFFKGPERVFLVMDEERLNYFDYNGARPHYLIYYSPEIVILSNQPGGISNAH